MAPSGQPAVTPEQLFAALDLDASLELLKDLIRIPSPSGGEAGVAALLIETLRSAGADDVRADDRGDVLAMVRGPRPGPTRLFVVHTDHAGTSAMVDAYEPELLPGEPFGKSGPVVRGLGAAAPKAMIVASVAALRAAIRVGMPQTGTIAFAATTRDLDANSDGVRDLFAAFPFDADWAVVGEPSSNRLVLGARGIAQVRLRLTGTTAHRGRPREAANPVYALADVLRAVEEEPLPAHPTLAPATVSPIDIASDAAPPLSPEHAEVVFDRRILPGELPVQVTEHLGALAAGAVAHRPSIQVEAELIRSMHAFSTDPESPLVRSIQRIATALLGRPLDFLQAPFATNSGYLAAERGIPVVGFGPGNVSDLGKDEHVEIAQLEDAARIYALMMAFVDPSRETTPSGRS